MDSQKLRRQAIEGLAAIYPNAPVQALCMTDHYGKDILRLRLVTREVTNDVCTLDSDPKKCLKRFIKQVGKYLILNPLNNGNHAL